MTFKEVLAQVLDWLQHDKRLSYRALKRQFALDDDALEDLKEALLYAHAQVIVDDGRGLVWTDDLATASAAPSASVRVPAPNASQAPIVYQEIRRRGRPIPTNDMWIAASALQHGFAVFSDDRHFHEVPDLHVGTRLDDFLL